MLITYTLNKLATTSSGTTAAATTAGALSRLSGITPIFHSPKAPIANKDISIMMLYNKSQTAASCNSSSSTSSNSSPNSLKSLTIVPPTKNATAQDVDVNGHSLHTYIVIRNPRNVNRLNLVWIRKLPDETEPDQYRVSIPTKAGTIASEIRYITVDFIVMDWPAHKKKH